MNKKIDGKRIEQMRSRKKYTKKQFAGMLKVSENTVWRWESGRVTVVRDTTFHKIVNVLQTTEGYISGVDQISTDASEHNKPEKEEYTYPSQINMALDSAVRNALSVVSKVYGVTQKTIVEFAPLLFFIAAEQSLKARRELQEEVQRSRDQWCTLSKQRDYLPLDDTLMWEIESYEKASIDTKDIFGKKAHDLSWEKGGHDTPWDWEGKNPFVMHLNKHLANLNIQDQETSIVKLGGPGSSPEYRICKDVFSSIVNNDETATKALMDGIVLIIEIPAKKEPAERAKTVNELYEERTKPIDLSDIDLSDIDLSDIDLSDLDLDLGDH